MKSNKSLWQKQSTNGRNETQNVLLFTGGRRHFIELYFLLLDVRVQRNTEGKRQQQTQWFKKKNKFQEIKGWAKKKSRREKGKKIIIKGRKTK